VGDVGRGAAHVEADDPVEPGQRRRSGGADDAAGRAGEDSILALEQAGIRFLSIGGTSAGSIVALLTAAAGKPHEARIEKLIEVMADMPIDSFQDGDGDAREFIDWLKNETDKLFQPGISFSEIGAWMSGTARLPFVVGVDRYLPAALSRVHPKFGTPYVALLTQSTLTTIVLMGALSRSSIHEAFVILLDLTLILGFLPLLYMFAALPVLARRSTGASGEFATIPGGAAGRWLACGPGFATTLLAIVTSIIPPADSPNPQLFVGKVVGGCLLMVGAGLIFFVRGGGGRR